MPLFWCSTKDTAKDEFIGTVIVNRPGEKEAVEATRDIVYVARPEVDHIEILAVPVPLARAGVAPVPHDAIGKLLSYEELETRFPRLTAIEIDDDGRVHEVAD